MFKTKVTLLLIAIFLLNLDFLLSYPAFADQMSNDNNIIVNNINSTGSFSHASRPECDIFRTNAIINSIITIVTALIVGVALITSSVGLLTALAITGMIAAIMGVWKSAGAWVVCTHSFVKHPVAYDSTGSLIDFTLNDQKYVRCTDKDYSTEDEYFKCLEEIDREDSSRQRNRGQNIAREILSTTTVRTDAYLWPKNSVQYSEYVRVCHRNPLSFGSLPSGLNDTEFDPREKEINNLRTGEWPNGNIIEFPWRYVDGSLECRNLSAGNSETIHGSVFKAVKKANKLCVELDSVRFAGRAWPQGVNIGCIDAPPEHVAPMCARSKIKFKDENGRPVDPADGILIPEGIDYKDFIKRKKEEGMIFDGYNNKGCFNDYVSKACYDRAGSGALAPVPITSMVVQCIYESLDNLVRGNAEQNRETFLTVAQRKLKNAITAALVLALVLFSLKVVSGGVRSPQEMYILILKFALVMYFTTGSTMSEYYGYLIKISNGLSDIVLSASSQSGNNICDYPVERYAQYTTQEHAYHAYLAPWDRLDCRILFYWGAPLKGTIGKLGAAGSIAGSAVLFGSAPVVLIVGSILGIIFAGGNILIAITALFMALLMMMVIMWMCYVYILSLIALTIVVVLSPLFIPMVLFQSTKGYFDAWVKELITYSLYPVILFSFLSFMFIACDKVFFKALKFEAQAVQSAGSGRVQLWFELENKDACNLHQENAETQDEEEKPLACMLQEYNFMTHSMLGGLISWAVPDFGRFKGYIPKELMKLGLVLFLFYHFLNALPGMAAELAGNHRAALGRDGTPGAMVGTAISWGRIIAGDAMHAASSFGHYMSRLGGAQTPNTGGSQAQDGSGSESLQRNSPQ